MNKLESVPSVFEAPALEEEILTFWRNSQAFEKLRKLRADKPLFRFVDGPITANNPMGVHHDWGRTLKDVFLRYQAMTGHSAKYQNGFDCQGLWVEVEVERSLGFNGKPDIERFGLDRKSTRLNSSHMSISYAVFCLKKKNKTSRPNSHPTPHYYRYSFS